jgi:hypothetical protein
MQELASNADRFRDLLIMLVVLAFAVDDKSHASNP